MIFPHHEVRAFLLLKVKPEMNVNPQTPSKKPDNKHLFPPKKSPKTKNANNHFKQLQLLVFLAMWKTMLQLECLSGRMVAPHKDISQMVNGQNHQRLMEASFLRPLFVISSLLPLQSGDIHCKM